MFFGVPIADLTYPYGTLPGPPSPLSHLFFRLFSGLYLGCHWRKMLGNPKAPSSGCLGSWVLSKKSMMLLPAQGTQLLSSTLLLFFDHWTALGHHQLGALARPDSSACTRVTGVNSMVSVVVVPAFVVFHSLNLDRLRSFRVIV